MPSRRQRPLSLILILAVGALLAAALAVQCLRTYWYTDGVLVPWQAEREAERQAGQVSAAARAALIHEPAELTPVLEQLLESAGDQLIWLRLLDMDGRVVALAGAAEGKATVAADWWKRIERHETPVRRVKTARGETYVAQLPFRMPRPAASTMSGRRPAPLVLELAIPAPVVESAFDGLRRNLAMGLAAALALLAAMLVFGWRAPRYLRGRYLESELRLAQRVQADLWPQARPAGEGLAFAAAAVAADEVGGDFHDVFELPNGQVAIVLGDVSGKGISAALLASVLQGAIRSSTAARHETACESINRMLCERTAGERFATLFWGVYDPASGVLRYVNAGHAAPMLRREEARRVERLDRGGPVLGLLPAARYVAGMAQLEPGDTLLIYSDGIHEAANARLEEFGEERLEWHLTLPAQARPEELRDRVMADVSAFAADGTAPDDRTLVVVRFAPVAAGQEAA